MVHFYAKGFVRSLDKAKGERSMYVESGHDIAASEAMCGALSPLTHASRLFRPPFL